MANIELNAFDFRGRTALVTGGTTGIGRSIVDGLVKSGAHVLVNAEDKETCETIVAEVRSRGATATALPANLSKKLEVARLAEQAWAVAGRIDHIFCNAGVTGTKKLGDQGYDEDSSLVFDINIHHPRRLCDVLLPRMAEAGSGSAVFTSSLSGLRGNKNIGVYSLTKAAIAQLARDYAVRYGPAGIRVNALSPGLIATGWEKNILSNPEAAERRMQMTPLRRIGQPSEIANVALFLASDLASFVTGHNLVADGGTVITDGS